MMAGVKLVSFTTAGSARLACNWLASCGSARIDDRATIVCGDLRSTETINEFVLRSNNGATVDRQVMPQSPGDTHLHVQWGTAEFLEISIRKLTLQCELSVAAPFQRYLFCDADTVLLRDPDEHLRQLHAESCERSIWFQSDRQDAAMPRTVDNHFNPGVHYCLAPHALFFEYARAWLLQRRAQVDNRNPATYLYDQAACNRAIDELLPMSAGVLPPSAWLNGARPWPPPGPERERVMLVHANWCIGMEVKERRLRDAGWWFASDDTLRECGL